MINLNCVLKGRDITLPTKVLVVKSMLFPVVMYGYAAAAAAKLLQSCPTLCDPMNTAQQASLSITNSGSPPKPMSIVLVMPSNHLILCRPLLLLPSIFPSIRVFSNESVLHIRWPSIGVSASASVLPMNIQDWFPLRLTGLMLCIQPDGLLASGTLLPLVS